MSLMRMELKKIVFETSSLTYKIMAIRRFKTPMATFFYLIGQFLLCLNH